MPWETFICASVRVVMFDYAFVFKGKGAGVQKVKGVERSAFF